MRKAFLTLSLIFLVGNIAQAQLFGRQPDFTRQDTLRGSITPERAWWDVTYYHLSVAVNLDDSSISGTNVIQYKVLEEGVGRMQIDLQEPMYINKVLLSGKRLEFEKDGNAYFVTLPKTQRKGSINEITVDFYGKPKVAIRAPWDGGFTWAKDGNGKPFIATSNQGIGASIWWPNKDHGYDEPDSMRISITTPKDLMDVSNGRLEKVEEHKNNTKTWHWFVSNPINNYGVNINIGDYVHFGEKFAGEKGELDMDYYVLRENKEKAIQQFADAPRMMKAFEHWFGPYPFYEDSYKLVEAPYLGMEHQSSITYGNKYENGYLGRDLSQSGWGLKFDFIIIHESGHEWFANNITYRDVADMWIHESFTNYSESLFLEYHYGKKAGNEYVIGTRLNILNDRPIIGIYDVNYEGSSDMYYKGANMLHTIRQIMNDDEKWRMMLRGLNKEFYHQTVTTKQIEEYISKAVGRDLTPVFDQYLRDVRIPMLEYSFKDGKLFYKWTNAIRKFDMPVKVFIDEKEVLLKPLTRWQSITSFGKNLVVDHNYYVGNLNTLGN